MQKLESIPQLGCLRGPLALAIGVFDGLHLGHQEVILAAREHAARHDGRAVVLTFDPHPLRVLRPESAPLRLCGARYRAVLLERMGLDAMLVCPFTPELASTEAEDFVAELVGVCRPLGCVSVGYAWTFGKNRGGTIHSLMDLGQRHGFAVYGVPPVRVDGEVVSSTLIRQAVAAGDLARAAALSGRPYALFGKVVEGRKLGRGLGFPTANVRVEAEMLPPYGVYAASADIGGRTLAGVANLGVRPTVEKTGSVPMLEVHFFDWQGDLYAQDLEVRLGAFMRPERKFAGMAELRAQIASDVLLARSAPLPG